MKKEERKVKCQKEDQTLNRVLWWFGGAVVLEFFLLMLNRFYINYDLNGLSTAHGIAQFLKVLVWVGLGAVAASTVWLAVWKSKGKKTFGPWVAVCASLAVLVSAFVSSVWNKIGVQLLYIAVPAAAVLALIYYLYQRDFFLVAIQGCIALLAMWGYPKLAAEGKGLLYGVFAIGGALSAALLVFTFLLQKKDGAWGKRQILGRKANYPLLYAAGGITLCAMIAALLLGGTAAYVALLLVVAWLFGAAVYFTVRLM